MKLIYVSHPKLVMERVAMMVADQADLDLQLAVRENAMRTAEFKVKLDRDKSGKPVFHELNSGWDNFKSESWVPGP